MESMKDSFPHGQSDPMYQNNGGNNGEMQGIGLAGEKGSGDDFLNQRSPLGTGLWVQESDLGASGGTEGGIGENVYQSIPAEPEQHVAGLSRHHAGVQGLCVTGNR